VEKAFGMKGGFFKRFKTTKNGPKEAGKDGKRKTRHLERR